jgi:hypothetical protein
MIIRGTTIELVDEDTRFVLKRTLLGEREVVNRKLAITNQLYHYERQRIIEGKDVFPNAPYQTHHIFFDKKNGWDYSELREARSHADKQQRLLLPFEVRNLKQWQALTWDEAETSFVNLANQGLQIVPYPIPKTATEINEWLERSALAEKKLLPSQHLMPVLTSRHNEEFFQDLMEAEITKSHFIGVHIYDPANPIELVNMSRLRAINSRQKIGGTCALLAAFNADKSFQDLDDINSAFALSTFGFDIFSPVQLSPRQMEAIKKQGKLGEQKMYDPTQGGYSTNADQQAWHDVGLIDTMAENVPIAEALNRYQAVIWFSTKFEQDDFVMLNDQLISKEDVAKFIRDEKSKWAVFWSRYGSSMLG